MRSNIRFSDAFKRNAVAAGFFNPLMRERVCRKNYGTRAGARKGMRNGSKMFDKPSSKQARKGLLSPVWFERQCQTQS